MSRPTPAKTRTSNWSDDDVEAIVEAFEAELERAGCVDLVEFLPERDLASFLPVAVELIRVDLEYSRGRGADKRIDEYRDLVPAVFEDPGARAAIAYEEFRLRRQDGELVETADYAQRYAVDTSGWASPDGGSTRSVSWPVSMTLTGDAAGSTTVGQFPRVGERFAGFELVELLGQGAFGVVYRARQRDLARREVVLKVTAPRSVEPERLARLQHSNIVPIYSVHSDRGLLGICMPYLGRHTLADFLGHGPAAVRASRDAPAEHNRVSTVAARVAEAETLPLVVPTPGIAHVDGAPLGKISTGEQALPQLTCNEAVDVVAQLAEGLAHAHDRGIVHSDLKPANVVIADDGTPLLVDFNLAGDGAVADRETILIGGTVAYMGPEHLQATLEGTRASPAGDIYSLGVIFYELLTNERPFVQRSGIFEECAAAMILDRRRGAPHVQRINPAVSPGLASIVARCLAPDVGDRYTEARQLAEDLRRHQADLPLHYAADRSLRERGGKWLRRNRRAVRAAAIAALVGLLVIASSLYVGRRERLLQLEAGAALVDFQHDATSASLSLYTPGTEPEIYETGRTAAKRALSRFGFAGGRPDEKNPNWSHLTPAQKDSVLEQGIKLQYALASTDAEKQQLFSDHDASSSLGTYLHGVSLIEKREAGAALKVFEGLLRRDSQDPTLWLLLGNAYYLAHRLSDAEACYTAVIALEPKAYAGYFYRGECRLDQRHFAEAAQDFDAVLQLRPGIPCGLLNRALAWRALGTLDRAEGDVTAAIDGGERDPRAYFVRALIRDARGNTEGAKADRGRGFEMPPLDAKGWDARGIAHLADDPRRAAEDFEQGLVAFPDTPVSPSLLHNLIHVYGDRLNEQQLALSKADRLVDLCPDEPSAWSTRAVLRARLGDRVGARRDAERAAAGQVSPLTSLQLACACALTSKSEPADVREALLHLQKALAGDPKLSARATTDPDLEPIRKRSEFVSMTAAAQKLTASAQGPAANDSAEVSAGSEIDLK
jgi:serine/threonine protein kinase/tetratricopeptide (TPR) repeat protein